MGFITDLVLWLSRLSDPDRGKVESYHIVFTTCRVQGKIQRKKSVRRKSQVRQILSLLSIRQIWVLPMTENDKQKPKRVTFQAPKIRVELPQSPSRVQLSTFPRRFHQVSEEA